MTFRHFLLTRFNIGLYDRKQKDRFGRPIDPEKWMDERMRLFREYTMPSVKAQSKKNFRWIIVFDEKTPPMYRDLISNEFSISEATVVTGKNFRKEAKFVVECDSGLSPVDRLITTRIDNDDMIHRDYIANIQAWFERKGKTGILTAPSGWVWNPVKNKLFHLRYVHNHFLTLIEKPQKKIRTVLASRHTNIGKIFKRHLLGEKHQWVEIIHGGNLANYCRGDRADPSCFIREHYGISESDCS